MDNNFEIEDLVQDESFFQWVMAPNAALQTKWQALQKENPEKVAVARNLVMNLRSQINLSFLFGGRLQPVLFWFWDFRGGV